MTKQKLDLWGVQTSFFGSRRAPQVSAFGPTPNGGVFGALGEKKEGAGAVGAEELGEGVGIG